MVSLPVGLAGRGGHEPDARGGAARDGRGGHDVQADGAKPLGGVGHAHVEREVRTEQHAFRPERVHEPSQRGGLVNQAVDVQPGQILTRRELRRTGLPPRVPGVVGAAGHGGQVAAAVRGEHGEARKPLQDPHRR